MQELRCKKCGKLLCKEDILHGKIEIKCYSCNMINAFDSDITHNQTELIKFLEIITTK